MASDLLFDRETADAVNQAIGTLIEQQPEYTEQRAKALEVFKRWQKALTSPIGGELFDTPIANVANIRAALYRRRILKRNNAPHGSASIARYLGVTPGYVANVEKAAGVSSRENIVEKLIECKVARQIVAQAAVHYPEWDKKMDRRVSAIRCEYADGRQAQTIALLNRPDAGLSIALIAGATQIYATYQGCRIRWISTPNVPTRAPRKPRTPCMAAPMVNSASAAAQSAPVVGIVPTVPNVIQVKPLISAPERRFATARHHAIIKYNALFSECWNYRDGALENVHTGERVDLSPDSEIAVLLSGTPPDQWHRTDIGNTKRTDQPDQDADQSPIETPEGSSCEGNDVPGDVHSAAVGTEQDAPIVPMNTPTETHFVIVEIPAEQVSSSAPLLSVATPPIGDQDDRPIYKAARRPLAACPRCATATDTGSLCRRCNPADHIGERVELIRMGTKFKGYQGVYIVSAKTKDGLPATARRSGVGTVNSQRRLI